MSFSKDNNFNLYQNLGGDYARQTQKRCCAQSSITIRNAHKLIFQKERDRERERERDLRYRFPPLHGAGENLRSRKLPLFAVSAGVAKVTDDAGSRRLDQKHQFEFGGWRRRRKKRATRSFPHNLDIWGGMTSGPGCNFFSV